MPSTVEDDFKALIAKAVDDYHANLEFRYNQFTTFINIAKQDLSFTNFTYITRGSLLGYVITYKDYIDYRIVVWFDPVRETVTARIVADEANKGFENKNPADGNNTLKYYDVAYLYEGDTVESRCERILTCIKEDIEDARALYIKMHVDHSMSAEQFTEKVQDLMHPDKESYLFVDPISCDQANKWFYDKLVEKIKAHPLIWKWFFTV